MGKQADWKHQTPGSRLSHCPSWGSDRGERLDGRLRFAAANYAAPCLLRAVLQLSKLRRAAPPGTRCKAVSSSYPRRKPDAR